MFRKTWGVLRIYICKTNISFYIDKYINCIYLFLHFYISTFNQIYLSEGERTYLNKAAKLGPTVSWFASAEFWSPKLCLQIGQVPCWQRKISNKRGLYSAILMCIYILLIEPTNICQFFSAYQFQPWHNARCVIDVLTRQLSNRFWQFEILPTNGTL